jgi:thiol-disulfide isomerase/thioredoxin
VLAVWNWVQQAGVVGLVAAMLGMTAGCPSPASRQESASNDSTGSTPAAKQVADSAGFDPATISVQIGDEAALEALVQKQAGKVVFVDYWATWCHPCVEAFPETVDLYEKYHDQGLTAIAVSLDEADNEPAVRKFLAKERVEFDNLISSYGQGPEAFEKFAVDQVPHFRLYDKTGKLRGKWDEHPKDLDAQVKALLAE